MSSLPQDSSRFAPGRSRPLRVLSAATQGGRLPDWARLKRAVRRRENWRQLTLFCVIGGSGYAVNLAVFAISVGTFRLDPHFAAVIAFVCAVCNNLLWNRRWTFPQHGPSVVREAGRFFVVSLGAFFVSLSVLSALVAVAAVPAILAQLVSILVATPLSFLGNKLWTFRSGAGVTEPVSVGEPTAARGQ